MQDWEPYDAPLNKYQEPYPNPQQQSRKPPVPYHQTSNRIPKARQP